jgi:hypothetical protein
MLDPWERWLVEINTGPRSRLGPWLVIALLLLLAFVVRAREKVEEKADGG